MCKIIYIEPAKTTEEPLEGDFKDSITRKRWLGETAGTEGKKDSGRTKGRTGGRAKKDGNLAQTLRSVSHQNGTAAIRVFLKKKSELWY